MFVLEALRAKYGDALLVHYGTKKKPGLILVDAGPAGVYNDAVRPRLDEIRVERGLAPAESLDIDLGMVSHLDADHITGIVDLMSALRKKRDAKQPLPWTIRRFWHNAFDDVIGNKDAALAATTASITASFGDVGDDGNGILASVGQGRDLRDLLKFFDLDGNKPFGGLVMAPHKKSPVKLDGVELTIIGPDKERLKKLQKDWDKKIKPILAKKKPAAEVAEFVDGSVYNLSSIVVLAKAGKKSMLLTGDARGDYTLEVLKGLGLLKKAPMKVDILKLPHHGSERNVAPDYFTSIVANHYVVSADGKFDNPDVGTLKMISAARPDDDFTIHLTNAPEDFSVKDIGKKVADFFAAEKKKKRKYKVVYRKAEDLGITIALA